MLKDKRRPKYKCKDILCLWSKRLTIIKMAILPKLTYRFSVMPVKTCIGFAENDKWIIKFIWKFKGPRIVKAILKENKLEDSQFPILELNMKL